MKLTYAPEIPSKFWVDSEETSSVDSEISADDPELDQKTNNNK